MLTNKEQITIYIGRYEEKPHNGNDIDYEYNIKHKFNEDFVLTNVLNYTTYLNKLAEEQKKQNEMLKEQQQNAKNKKSITKITDLLKKYIKK